VVAVGLPLSLDGSVGPAAEAVLAEVAELAKVLAVPVETVDERFTTVTADQQLKAGGVRGRDRTKIIDQAAAAVLLQAWLDRQETERC
jgi:putative Holliday junction resolvase